MAPVSKKTVLPLVTMCNSMSIERNHSAIVTILQQYHILRTALYVDNKSGKLSQEVQPTVSRDSYSFALTTKMLFRQEKLIFYSKTNSIMIFHNWIVD